ncbi:hypothetical protein KOW79_015228 [Hemibagrus wyckioides]|uniref:Ig-like domain-containing protein n=1 Tax=Hemibagrus wyckioides TaxID=337641 RepID=A0A9D3ND94_9TELE|nr:uncharacterized protein cd8b isoform X1 [Hemibagrus wyckioides]KAG7320813.1 hypothetical protein KOW79_015228 [Hemibagrus wyckioides]
MTLNHIWSFLCFLTAVSAAKVSYPSINGSESLTCDCPDHRCQKVYWYRLLQGSVTPEFLMSANSVNIPHYAKNIDEKRFKSSVTDSGKVQFTLRITGLREQDAGFYSCVLSSQNSAQDPKDLMPVGYSILPGVKITTQAPTTVKHPKRVNGLFNKCKSSSRSVKGCKSLVLWSCIGAVLLLVVVLISTLYYFSRLPKKCRHHFVKKQQMS